MAVPTAESARGTAAETWIRGCPPLENHRTMYAQVLDPADSRSVGGFGCFQPFSRPFTPAATDGARRHVGHPAPDAKELTVSDILAGGDAIGGSAV